MEFGFYSLFLQQSLERCTRTPQYEKIHLITVLHSNIYIALKIVLITSGYATWFTAGVQSASLIMT